MGQSAKREYGGSGITSNCINFTNLLKLWRENLRVGGKLGDQDCDGLVEHWRT
ncbi:hypothetical protein C0J52_18773 [Blattella germanica]|nr:hypothetical protein C0J52_18773 [Blattella germanica]